MVIESVSYSTQKGEPLARAISHTHLIASINDIAKKLAEKYSGGRDGKERCRERGRERNVPEKMYL